MTVKCTAGVRARRAEKKSTKKKDALFLALVLGLVGEEGDPGLAAMVPVEVRSHEDTGAANRRLFAEARHLVISIDLVELEDGELHLLVLVRNLLRLRVHFLLALLRAALEARGHEDRRFLREDVLYAGIVIEADATVDEAQVLSVHAVMGGHFFPELADRSLGVDGNRLALQRPHEDTHSGTVVPWAL